MREAFAEAARLLRQTGIETPELDARVLLCHAVRLSQEAYIARAGEALAAEAKARFEEALARRLKREPVARILGSREFYGRDFAIGPDALDPRADTETLIEAALAIVDDRQWRNSPLHLLDLGTGTGCILATLLAELPRARGIGTDKSPEALALAVANAERLGVSARASFLAADWLDGIAGRFDLVLSNPPYLAQEEIEDLAEDVALHDPRLALKAAPTGLRPIGASPHARVMYLRKRAGSSSRSARVKPAMWQKSFAPRGLKSRRSDPIYRVGPAWSWRGETRARPCAKKPLGKPRCSG